MTEFAVTFFRDEKATSLRAEAMALPTLRDLIQHESAPSKAELPWLKLATFGDKRTAKGSLRHDNNVLTISGVELDYDGEELTFDYAVEVMRQSGLQGLVYTSPSHSPARPRWRVLLPTSAALANHERTKLAARANGLFGGAVAGESFTLSQGYFFGSVNGNPAHCAVVVEGDYIDQRGDLDAGAIGKKAKSKANGKASGFEAHLARMGDGPGLEGFHNPLRDAVAAHVAIHGPGFDRAALMTRLRAAVADAPTTKPRDYLDDGHLDAHLDALIDSAIEKFGTRNDGEPLSPKGSEDAIALDVVRDHGHELRYVAELGKWFRWDGCRWAADRTVGIYDLIRPYVRREALNLDKVAQQRGAARAAIVAGVERFAQSDRRVATLAEQFDADPWLLNTPGGIVDLRTGEIRPCDPLAMCSKSTAVAPAPPGTPAPRWAKFLQDIAGYEGIADVDRDGEYIGFFQRMFGYMLTGVTVEHALFFGYGPGGNGKGVLTGTLREVMGDYAIQAQAEVFMASMTERHPTELADLRGARLVVASEINQGQRWNESRLKSMTGGDAVKARFMRQDFFQYTPQFKLLIVGNHQPSLGGVDEAIRRRMHLLPFTVVIPEQERDKQLPEKLHEEWPAILRWGIDGCIAWQRDGLKPPSRVIDATGEYLAEQDSFMQWFGECCERQSDSFELSTALFNSWKAWAGGRGEFIGSHKAFSARLTQHGLKTQRAAGGVKVLGVKCIKPAGGEWEPS